MSLFDLANKKVWVTGHQGMVGSALMRQFKAIEDVELLTVSRQQLDLSDQRATNEWLEKNRPEVVFHSAALVGGIEANKNNPVEFLGNNLSIGLNVINGAAKHGVKKLINLGSSCFYPKVTEQPIQENALLKGKLEPTNEAYALAKITLAKLCQFYYCQYQKDFITVVPTNLYGFGDNFDPQTGHVIASLINKFINAKKYNHAQVNLWGTGKPLREFMHVDDAAQGLLFLAQHYSSDKLINLSGGETVSIRHLAELIAELVDFKGKMFFDTDKPDGMMKKSLDNTLIKKLGWQPSISLTEGLTITIDDYLRTKQS